MLWSVFVASLVTWAFGVVSSHTFGGRVHLLLGVAIAIIVIRIVQGHRDAARDGQAPSTSLPRSTARST